MAPILVRLVWPNQQLQMGRVTIEKDSAAWYKRILHNLQSGAVPDNAMRYYEGWHEKESYKQGEAGSSIVHFVAGTTARCAAALVGVNRKTAAYYFHRLREIICYHLEREADRVVGV